MSRRINAVIQVLAEIWARRHWGALARSAAVTEVARRYGLARSTVHSKLARELAPCIECVDEFDHLVLLWLCGQGDELRRVILSRCVTDKDRSAVQEFFVRPGWTSIAG